MNVKKCKQVAKIASIGATVLTAGVLARKHALAKKMSEDTISWVCPVCKKKHTTTSLSAPLTRVCKGCGSTIKLEASHIPATLKERNVVTPKCKSCAYYKNFEGNWYYTRGGGTCEREKNPSKLMKMPNDLCHRPKDYKEKRN